MSRLQLALNVSDLDAAIEFYSKVLNTRPHKVRPGYANFAVEDPPLKLVLFEGGEDGTINHLGVEVFSTEEVAEAGRRLAAQGFATEVEEAQTCCHAVQNKVWITGPDGRLRWEVYKVVDDDPQAPPLIQLQTRKG